MTDDRREPQQSEDENRTEQRFQDLEIKQEDADKVKGGRMLYSSDPCEGGE